MEELLLGLDYEILQKGKTEIEFKGMDYDSRKIKDVPDTSFILQEAIEKSRNKPIGHRENKEINGKNVEISVEKYKNPVLKANYKKIRASFEGQSFELIEACNEEGF